MSGAILAAGAPFFRFNVIDTERQLDVEVGVPVAVAGAAERLFLSRRTVDTHVARLPFKILV